jgi:hypothetical protein
VSYGFVSQSCAEPSQFPATWYDGPVMTSSPYSAVFCSSWRVTPALDVVALPVDVNTEADLLCRQHLQLRFGLR